MLQNANWSEDRSYRSGSSYEPISFYLEALLNSTHFDLLLGYFSSAAINILSLGFASFLHSGGTVRMVVNHILSEADKEAIEKGFDGGILPGLLDIENVFNLKESLNEYGQHFFDCISWLISHKKIEIVIIRPKGKKGIAHYKSGVFYDQNDSVGFKASSNFTLFGLLENLEELDVFLGWEDIRSMRFNKNQETYFESIFSKKADFIEYLSIEEVQSAIVHQFKSKDIEELLVKEKDLIKKKADSLKTRSVKKVIRKIESKILEEASKPKFPYKDGPREYQIQAYENWKSNDFKGVFAMATGTGKTITSLNCLLNRYSSTGSYRSIILVPTTALLEQWKQECRKFKFQNIISVSSRDNWSDKLSFFNTASKFTDVSYIVVVTYASFSRKKFGSHLGSFPKDTVLIADEMHNAGSPRMLKMLSDISINYRIGLSATPHRRFDDMGNEAIESFFNDKPPYVYSYSMKQALEVGWLCQYTYFPHVVRLTEHEFEKYIKISKQLLVYLDPVTGMYKDSPIVEDLLLRRKRIIHKAENKLGIFEQILKEEYKSRGNLHFTLVYVPEGVDPEFYDIDFVTEDEEEMKLINTYTRIVKDIDYSVFVSQFTGETANREQILQNFENCKTHVLTSMKCLDEGVDIPRSELAIFCASTGNPRQFIQRRGRVLRTHDDKAHAVIHDLVVVPEVDSSESYFEMERNLIRKELERVIDFSQLSLNQMDTYEVLEPILDHYGLNLYDNNPE